MSRQDMFVSAFRESVRGTGVTVSAALGKQAAEGGFKRRLNFSSERAEWAL